MNSDALALVFMQNLDRIASDLLSAAGISHSREIDQLSDPLMRWVDFRLRYVDPKPRQVLLSDRFPKSLPTEASDALCAFVDAVQSGVDINGFQGKGLTKHHDTSSENPLSRTDLLWSDWGILHFHLTTQAPRTGMYSPRADWLLFAIFFEDRAAFIDVRPHKEQDVFESPELIEITLRNWPPLAARSRLPGIVSRSTPQTPAEIKASRSRGMASFVVMDDKAYAPPGGGVTQASTSVRVSRQLAEVRHAVRDLAALVVDPTGQVQTDLLEHERASASFILELTKKGLGVFDEQSKRFWNLPRGRSGMQPNPLTILQETIAPEWVCAELHKLAPT